ncbi:fimbria/pilus outer membrane usher protein, partial [Ralstonia pseudosolanacearum]
MALVALHASAQATGPPNPLLSFGDSVEREVFLEVSINGANTAQLVRFLERRGALMVSPDALRPVGVNLALTGQVAGKLALDSIAGLRYAYNRARQSINLIV